MDARALNQLIRFESPASVEDNYGNVTSGWTQEFTLAAQITPLRGGESVMAHRLSGRQPVVIRVRQSGNSRLIKSDWRGVNTRTGEIYAITSPAADMIGRRTHLDIIAEAGVAP